MNTAIRSALTLAALTGSALAGVQTTSQSFSFSSGQTPAFLDFDYFNTMGGTRQLTGVTIRLDVDVFAVMTFENYTLDPVASGTWSAEVLANFVFQAGTDDGGEGNGPPFFGLGGIGGEFTMDLPAGTPNPNPDPFEPPVFPGTAEYVFGDAQIHSVIEADAFTFDDFTGDGTFTGVYGQFQEFLFLDGPGWGLLGGYFSTFDETGTLTIEYEYTTIPAPASAVLLAGLGSFGFRRRR